MSASKKWKHRGLLKVAQARSDILNYQPESKLLNAVNKIPFTAIYSSLS